MIEATNLVRHYPVVTGLRSLFSAGRHKVVRAVDDISFQVDAGKVLGIVGESGCGKSTTAKMLVGLESPTAGSISIDQDDLGEMRIRDRLAFHRQMQMVFQDPYGSINPSHDVFQIVSRPLVYQGEKDDAKIRTAVLKAMEQVGLNPPELYLNKHPHLLSGGQRQRLCIARAIILNPRFLVADEPISMLDVSIKWDIIRLLRQLVRERNLSLVYITHDLATVPTICDDVAIMYLGKIVEMGPVKKILREPRHPYTKALIASIPSHVPGANRQAADIKGVLPDAIKPQVGCLFHDRCKVAIDVCKTESPALVNVTGSQVACHLVNSEGGN
ncbi:oligopeptide/dipeptide ABC transporter ATP-binding protein [Lentilitoribacter sp. EG35]|uniref:oligopeptide/dipeptide ABC transporter ATP-binding protein n=1 Tax=Lentilitoribacter sp. EG35 TaxID=3234192 RepID=UPI00345F3E61